MVSRLPIFQDQNNNLMLMQTNWSRFLNPWLSSPLSSGLFLNDIALNAGLNVINHLLGRPLQGWFVIDSNAAATIYRSAPLNNKTLNLTVSADVTVSLYVF